MQTYIALFRGINVGGKNKVVMKELVSVMENNGFEQVKTYIQSGNVVFVSAEEQLGNIAPLMEEHFGFTPAVLIMSPADLQVALENNPFPNADGKACHFYFCDKNIETVDKDKVEALKTETEDYAIIGNLFYLHAPEGVGRSKLAAGVEKCIGLPVTARNLNTVRKLEQMVLS
jgi:uncharacterized protein (DUF1697 family)